MQVHSIVQSPLAIVLPAGYAEVVLTADPLVFHGKTRARNASEYMKVTEWIVANMSSFNFPVISFCSENDTMCDPDGSRMLIDRSQVSFVLYQVTAQQEPVTVAYFGHDLLTKNFL